MAAPVSFIRLLAAALLCQQLAFDLGYIEFVALTPDEVEKDKGIALQHGASIVIPGSKPIRLLGNPLRFKYLTLPIGDFDAPAFTTVENVAKDVQLELS